MTVSLEDIVRLGKETLSVESEAIKVSSGRLSESFYEAFKAILRCEGKVILTGIGKSGHIAQKIASTLSSTGTPAFFVHPSEALHGDFGMFTVQDCVLALSYGGETREILAVVKFARRLKIPIIAIIGNQKSSLAQLADHVLDGGVEREADTLGLAPTASSTVALALGDALAVVLMRARGMTREKFATLHPEGSLGRELAQVVHVMRQKDEIAFVGNDAGIGEVLEGVTKYNFGIVAVLGKDRRLCGCISDGDIRRCLQKIGTGVLAAKASDIMTPHPKTIPVTARAVEAISKMEDHKITAIYVTSENKEVVGLVRLHDIISANII